jgi:hypothetical protein
MEDIGGWPHWEVIFNKDGDVAAGARSTLLTEVAAAGLRDLIVFSHGWNNSISGARAFYIRFLGLLPGLAPTGSTARVGTLGVFWPSLAWSDEPIPDVPGLDGGGAAGFAPDGREVPAEAFGAAYDPAQQALLDELMDLLRTQPREQAELERFHALLGELVASEPVDVAPEDAGVLEMLTDDARSVAERYASALEDLVQGGAPASPDEGGAARMPESPSPLLDDEGAAAGLADVGSRLWRGAQEALRQVTYWQMKVRAGTVGEKGLGPLVNSLHERAPELRVHLVGHSFGARLVSFALRAAPTSPLGSISSLVLLEAAFSHWAFAPHLPFASPSPAGALAGMNARVDGPLVACFSRHDSAVGVLYPLASRASGDDAAGLIDELRERWGGIGYDGVQGVQATPARLQPPGSAYPLTPGGFTNVDGTDVIVNGGPPSGAHSDILHPEVGWLVLAAARIG